MNPVTKFYNGTIMALLYYKYHFFKINYLFINKDNFLIFNRNRPQVIEVYFY